MLNPKRVLIFTLIITVLSTILVRADPSQSWYKVVSIIDGDTLRIEYHGRIKRVRLYGIDAPERGDKGYFKAAAALENLCYGQKIRLEFPGKKHRDKYHRLLAKVYLPDGRMVNEVLYRMKVVRLYKPTPLFKTR